MRKKSENYVTKLYAASILIAVLFLGACSSDDEAMNPDTDPVDPIEVEPPITLSCDYFDKNPNTVLKDNPNAPIDYIVTCSSMNVPDDVTIEPGVTIAFDTDAGFWVRDNGSLNAVGTPEKPITFTGVNKERGSWGGIFFSSNDPKNEMNHTVFEYAGGKAVSWATEEKGGVVIGSGASLKFKNNLVQHCKGWGLSLYYSANDATTTIENNTFNENEKPLQISLPFIGLVKGDNKFTNNTSNKAEVKCVYSIAKTQTMHKLPVPYLVRGSFNFGIDKEAHLTIEPGTVIEMTEDKRINVNGSLKMVGTASERIIVRGEIEAPGSWGNIHIASSSPNNQINYVDIKHAGANPHSYHYYKGAISMANSTRLDIDNTHFEDIFSCLLYRLDRSVLTWGSNITSKNVNVAELEDCEY